MVEREREEKQREGRREGWRRKGGGVETKKEEKEVTFCWWKKLTPFSHQVLYCVHYYSSTSTAPVYTIQTDSVVSELHSGSIMTA